VKPSNPVVRSVLSVCFVLHLAAVVVYVWPWTEQLTGVRAVVTPYLHVLQLRQKWNMFRKPQTWDKFLVHEGIRADGTVIEVLPQNTAPTEPFFKVIYDRRVKAHFLVAYEKTDPKVFTPDYADWVCRQAPDDVVSIRLQKRAVKHLSPKQWRRSPDRERRELVYLVWEQDCP
jgi:hypothetical protein